ncbi:hypothetical protein TPHV1_140009 [Treponema phagedenis]|uniref:Uncharacterized protein n=1 Tax=Treponema phagedenis TaxID=162 RepID=A0A0B7GWQ8_TREPH|nr:hypothetical protein TPHV1_140009 [Treponema phagedenis]
MAVVLNRIEFENYYICIIGVFKLAGLVLTWTAKSAPPRTAVVPRSSDVLKQDYLQSFKTRRFGFDKEVKN